MINLFEQDKAAHLADKISSIKKYFHDRLQGKCAIDPEIQRACNEISSLIMYQNIRKDMQPGILNTINKLYEKYDKHLDANLKKFAGDLPTNFWNKVFELIVAEWAGKKFELGIGLSGSTPDLLFPEGFIECTARAASQLDRYDKILPDFDLYLGVAKLFYSKFTDPEFLYFPENIKSRINIKSLTDDEKEYVFKNIPPKEAVTKINEHFMLNQSIARFSDWVCINRYACAYFKEIVPDEIFDNLELIQININQPPAISSKLEAKYQEDHRYPYLKTVALNVLDKTSKIYFSGEKLGLIAVSLAMFNPGFFPLSCRDILDYIANNLQVEINKILIKNDKKRSREEVERILCAFTKLYAILIDSTFYNWFPEVMGARMLNGYDNFYGIIYNKNVNDLVAKKILDSKILNTVPYQANIHLENNLMP